MYNYEAKLIRVIDGDTIKARVDLGFYVATNITIRLYGINAPESRTKDLEEKARGLAAKARLIELLGNGEFVLNSQGTGKYGRWLGVIFANDRNVNQTLLDEGHAETYSAIMFKNP